MCYRRARVTIAAKDSELDPEETQRQREQEAEIRRKQSHDMVAESIKRELAESRSLVSPCPYSNIRKNRRDRGTCTGC